MANFHKNPSKLFLSFSFIFLLFSTLFNSSSAFFPSDNYLLDCGSTVDSTVDNRVFISDSNSDSDSDSVRLSATRKISLKDENPSPNSPSLYQTARLFTKPSSYGFQIKSKGTHLVRLHFSPFSSQEYNLSSAFFHVSANGFLLLREFRVSTNAHVIKEYIIRVDEENLVISFVPFCKSSFAFVNAIEVITAPEELISDVAKLVTPLEIENYNGLSKQALETIYRINIGGPKVTPFNDTLWRTWIPDENFLKVSSFSKAVSFSGRIKYQIGGATREVAPDNVYNTGRVMNGTDFPITWVFPVSLGYKYLVRLHFCDIISLAVNELYFNVFINGYLAYKDLDLSDMTTQMLASPYYVDFVVAPESPGVVRVAIGPSSMSSPSRANAILNGLEIMRMNNSMGSLDGEFSVNMVSGRRSSGTVGVFLCSVLGGFAFMSLVVTAFMLLLRRSSILKNPMAWSPLPMDFVDDNSRHGKPPTSAARGRKASHILSSKRLETEGKSRV
ncbi:receptor-like kinase isoform X2 [Tasmannia lanceolata]|uniref:receptor-like kinase isoform X2 n=1 Tax=Tasmannia lanceolata TaxID=3420 RepID=UPI0040647CC4